MARRASTSLRVELNRETWTDAVDDALIVAVVRVGHELQPTIWKTCSVDGVIMVLRMMSQQVVRISMRNWFMP